MRCSGNKCRTLAAEAYQVIGALASYAGMFEQDDVGRALDYFGDRANGEAGKRAKGGILPWGCGLPAVSFEAIYRHHLHIAPYREGDAWRWRVWRHNEQKLHNADTLIEAVRLTLEDHDNASADKTSPNPS